MINILRFLTPKNDIAYIEITDTLRQGIEKMRRHGHTDIPVLDKEGHYMGTLSESNILWTMMDENQVNIKYLETISVKDVFTPAVMNRAVKNDASIQFLLERVKEHKFVPVVDDRDIFIGIVKRKDVINYFLDKYLVSETK